MIISLVFSLASLTSSPAAGHVPVPPPVFAPGCNPPANICDTLRADCLAGGGDPERCELVADAICPGSPCLAKDVAIRDFIEQGLDFGAMAKHMAAGLEGCSCKLACTDSDDLSLQMLFSICLAYPSAIGDDCEEPSAGQCVALLTLSEDYCDIDACEYVQCQRDIMAQGEVCAEPPSSCAKLEACDAAENGGATGGPGVPHVPGPDDWHVPPPSPASCLRLAEVFVTPVGDPEDRQWVKIVNICDEEISTDRALVRWTKPGKGWANNGILLAGITAIGPGQCAIVGGGDSVPENFMPNIDLPISFTPPTLDDGAREVAGIGLFDSLAPFGTLPWDAVAYGKGVATFPDAHGKSASPVVVKMKDGHSLVRNHGGWHDSANPSPCSTF